MKIGNMYAFCDMPDAGLFFVVIEPFCDDIGVITLPNLQNDIVNKEDMGILLESGTLELVDCLPKEILAVCQKEYPGKIGHQKHAEADVGER